MFSSENGFSPEEGSEEPEGEEVTGAGEGSGSAEEAGEDPACPEEQPVRQNRMHTHKITERNCLIIFLNLAANLQQYRTAALSVYSGSDECENRYNGVSASGPRQRNY